MRNGVALDKISAFISTFLMYANHVTVSVNVIKFFNGIKCRSFDIILSL